MRVPLEVEEAVEFDDGNVVVKIAGVEVGVDGDGQDVQLNVGVELTVIVHVPFSQSDLVVEKNRLNTLQYKELDVELTRSSSGRYCLMQ